MANRSPAGNLERRLLVGNLDRRTTETQLERFFSSLGTVVSVRIPHDQQTGEPLGYGWVDLPSAELAKLAFTVFNGRELDGRVLRLRRAEELTDPAAEFQGLPAVGRVRVRH